jgi:hypothetical protein
MVLLVVVFVISRKMAIVCRLERWRYCNMFQGGGFQGGGLYSIKPSMIGR